MALLKKINNDWQPSEKRDLNVGETLDFPGPYTELVKTGMAVLVDESGNELELPNQVLGCPVCFNNITGLLNFVDHVATHAKKPVQEAVVVKKEEPIKVIATEVKTEGPTAEELKNKRLAAMAEGRRKAAEAKKAK